MENEKFTHLNVEIFGLDCLRIEPHNKSIFLAVERNYRWKFNNFNCCNIWFIYICVWRSLPLPVWILQIFALFIRPQKDHKYRYFWNIYHHSLGYTIIVLGIINIFRGFDILSPEKKWKATYIIVIAALGVIALLLEVITWIVVLKRKSSTKPYDGYNNGQSRQQPLNM